MSLAGHLAKICQSDPEKIVRVKSMKTICENITKLKLSQEDRDRQLFEHHKLGLHETKEELDKTEKKI